MHYAVPRIFHGAGSLERLFTDFAATKKWKLARPLTLGIDPLRRMFSRIPEGISRKESRTFRHSRSRLHYVPV